MRESFLSGVIAGCIIVFPWAALTYQPGWAFSHFMVVVTYIGIDHIIPRRAA